MQGRRSRHAAALLLLGIGCRQDPEPSAPLPAESAIAPVTVPAPSAPAATPKVFGSTFFAISRGGSELGLLELTPGRPSVLTLAKNDAPARELKKQWSKLDREGVNAPEAARQRLEAAEYYVEEVPRLDGTVVGPDARKLNVSRHGEAVGSLDFSTDPPTLSIATTRPEGSLLKSHWDAIATREQLEVRFHRLEGGEKLVTLSAKPGEPSYPNLVRLHLLLRHQYDEQHGYALSAVP